MATKAVPYVNNTSNDTWYAEEETGSINNHAKHLLNNSFKLVECGGEHTCGIHNNGSTACWGNNDDGQAKPPEGLLFETISLGWHHSCGIIVAGTYDNDEYSNLVCWGNDDYKQLKVPDGRYKAVAAGGGHTCALLENGGLSCWGDDKFGQTEHPRGVWAQVTSGGAHACAQLSASKSQQLMYCWGYKAYDSDPEWTDGYHKGSNVNSALALTGPSVMMNANAVVAAAVVLGLQHLLIGVQGTLL